MSDAGFASLSPTLLARKGGARPAMRPQHGMPGKIDPAQAAAGLEDLGWNDMGEEDREEAHDGPSPGAQIVRLGSGVDQDPLASDRDAEQDARSSPVRETIERIARKLDSNRQSVASATAKPLARPLSSGKRRAAFTLRLDPERHLRLRLASTVSGCSAQQLVTEALDALLAQMPEIEGLAAQVKRP